MEKGGRPIPATIGHCNPAGPALHKAPTDQDAMCKAEHCDKSFRLVRRICQGIGHTLANAILKTPRHAEVPKDTPAKALEHKRNNTEEESRLQSGW